MLMTKKFLGFHNHFSKLHLQIQMNIQKKRLNLQQENMRPQRNIEINDRIPDEKYQNNKIDDKQYDERDQIGKIDERK